MILHKIREATAGLHSAIESETMMHYFTKENISLEIYTQVLRKFYGFFLPLETALAEMHFGQYLSDFNDRRKAISIKNDLDILQPGSIIPLNPNILPLTDVHTAFGVMYVMEGSTLGGTVIAKMLQSQLEINSTNGGSFFSGYGNNTGKMWKEFLQQMEEHYRKYQKEEEMISGAVNTFTELHKWLKN